MNEREPAPDAEVELDDLLAEATHAATGAWDVELARNPLDGRVHVRDDGDDHLPDTGAIVERQAASQDEPPRGISHTLAQAAALAWADGDAPRARQEAIAALAFDEGWEDGETVSVTVALTELGVGMRVRGDANSCRAILAHTGNPEHLHASDTGDDATTVALRYYYRFTAGDKLSPPEGFGTPDDPHLDRQDAYALGVMFYMLYRQAVDTSPGAASNYARTALAYTRAFGTDIARELLAAV